jgi:hypothetical protein
MDNPVPPPPAAAPPPPVRGDFLQTGSRPPVPVRTPLYMRRPALWRRGAAVLVALLLLGLVAWWLDGPQALAIWALFSLFVVLWPNWPPPTPAEERAQAWPFEP